MLACGVGLGLLVPPLAALARPLMPVTVFLFVLGTLLRVGPRGTRGRGTGRVAAAARRDDDRVPVALGIAARLAGMPYDWSSRW